MTCLGLQRSFNGGPDPGLAFGKVSVAHNHHRDGFLIALASVTIMNSGSGGGGVSGYQEKPTIDWFISSTRSDSIDYEPGRQSAIRKKKKEPHPRAPKKQT